VDRAVTSGPPSASEILNKGDKNMPTSQSLNPRQRKESDPIGDLSFHKFMIYNLPIAVVALSSELKITEFNPWAETITGYSAREAIGRYCGDILQGGMCNVDCPLKTVINRMKPVVRIETTIRNKLGEIIPVRMSTAGLFAQDGKLIGALEALQDISYLRALEGEKANLISMFAHDMMSSISGIHGLGLRLLIKSDSVKVEDKVRYLKIITNEAAKLKSLVHDFLEFSRLQTGRLTLNFSATSVDSELLELCDSYQAKAFERRLKLKLHLDKDLPLIEADADRLRRVFTNLLDNAIKFSKEGGNITVTAGETEREIVVSIMDEGIGIAPKELPYIFEVFHRAESTKKKKGYGIGLAIVKTIVEGHGGRVIVSSEPDKGSVFTVFLSKKAQPKLGDESGQPRTVD
jgi:PAS domain S-box-containing protein